MSGLLLGHIIDPGSDDKWEDIAAEIETLEVGLEKTDISIDDIALVWVRKQAPQPG